MLTPETPFPHPGSYALLLAKADPRRALSAAPDAYEAPQLARIIRTYQQRPGVVTALISLPLRDGASGNREVDLDDLTDATPLTGKEAREMIDISRELTGKRVRDRQGKEARYAELRLRAVFAPLLELRLRKLAERDASKRKAA